MGGVSYKLTNRSRKGLKGLPSSIELPEDISIEDAKKSIARAANVSDHNRIGIFDPVSKKTFKDRNAPLRNQPEVVKRGELLVKDLGIATFFIFYMLRFVLDILYLLFYTLYSIYLIILIHPQTKIHTR